MRYINVVHGQNVCIFNVKATGTQVTIVQSVRKIMVGFRVAVSPYTQKASHQMYLYTYSSAQTVPQVVSRATTLHRYIPPFRQTLTATSPERRIGRGG
jgi:hypothetical protein